MTIAARTVKPFHLLLIAPSAPPKNSPEAMQVGRFLNGLDPAVRVTLVTTPIVRGWQWEDASLAIQRPGMRVIAPALPMHRLTQRLLGNHRLAALHMPDSDFWLPWYAKQVIKQLDGTPDVIYSRSAPFSSALLARRLKAILRRPWMMHLSDPWAGSPYRSMPAGRAAKDRELEQACFADADLVALTTEGQADFYRDRYPQLAQRIIVTPNMMPLALEKPVHHSSTIGRPLRLTYTGALYGAREPSTLLAALQLLHSQAPREAAMVTVDFYGNMSAEIASAINATPGCKTHGAVSFKRALEAQAETDVLLTVEPSGTHPLLLHYMPSKNLDYMASGKPILAITPSGSETARFCEAGQGWAVAPGDVVGLAGLLLAIVQAHTTGTTCRRASGHDFSHYRAENVAATVFHQLGALVSRSPLQKGGACESC